MRYILFILLFVNSAIAEPLRGLDVLGLAKHDARMIAAELDPNSAIGVLGGTFGDVRPNLSILLNTGKIQAVRAHLGDGTVSNHACSDNLLSLSFLASKAKIWKAFADQYPSVKWYASPWLEHGCKDKNLVNSWFSTLKKYFPQAIPVCSSNGQGFCPANALKENHGGGHGDITSGDGVSTFDSDSIDFRNSGRVIALAWHNCMNGRLTSEKPGDPVPLPPNRTNWCGQDEIRHAVRIMRAPAAKPNIPECRDILPPDIAKPRSENYGIGHGDSRQNKPMVITKFKTSQFNLISLSNQIVGCFKFYGSFGTNQSRYYEGNCSGKNPTQLQDLMGNEWGTIRSGDTCFIYNAIRRLGVYR